MELQPKCEVHEGVVTQMALFQEHIREGKFWRGTIITIFIAFITIAVTQLNIANNNSQKMLEANAKLTKMVEINTSRLDKLESWQYDTFRKAGLK